MPSGPGTLALALEAQHAARGGPLIAGTNFNSSPAARPGATFEGHAASWGELHFKLLELISPPSLLVDAEHEIVHLSPGAGRFLQYAGGEPSTNLLRAIHPSLRIELRAALYQASQGGTSVDVEPLAGTFPLARNSMHRPFVPGIGILTTVDWPMANGTCPESGASSVVGIGKSPSGEK